MTTNCKNSEDNFVSGELVLFLPKMTGEMNYASLVEKTNIVNKDNDP